MSNPKLQVENGVYSPQVSRLPSSSEDRLLHLLEQGQSRQEGLLRDISRGIGDVKSEVGELRSEIVALQVTPSLIRTMTIGMVVMIVLVGIAASANVALSTGLFSVTTSAGQAP